MNYQIKKHSDRLFQVLLSPPIDGFDNFICSWIYLGKETVLVDPGPLATTGDLLAALNEIGIKALDYILLTHIHIDHAGGTGEISTAFPGTPIVCHEIGRPHLVDPERLWQGTVKTLGDIGRAYGEIRPVSDELLVNAQDFSTETITAILTPGHAPHHVSFLMDDGILFAGEAGGVHSQFKESVTYLRPATPPKFFMDTSITSIDRLLDHQPKYLCYGHTIMTDDAVNWLKKHKQQLRFWENVISEEKMAGDEANIFERCTDRLIGSDPLMQGLAYASETVLGRERYFIQNSIKGYLGYLDR